MARRKDNRDFKKSNRIKNMNELLDAKSILNQKRMLKFEIKLKIYN